MSGEAVQLQWIEGGSVTSPRGFRAGSVYAGIKTPGPGKRDVGVLLSDVPCAAAGVFTANRVAAAPVRLSRDRVRGGSARGVVFNAGNANAATGELGLRTARETAEIAGASFGVDPESLLVASTGVIGVPLPMEKIREGIGRLEIHPEGGHEAARCIMTTDTRPKETAVDLFVGEWSFRMGAICKGAAMIHPNMATMLCFVTTDAAVDPAFLHQALRKAVDVSFNMITVDGDTSTNDTVLVFANGLAGTPTIGPGTPGAEAFEDALAQVCTRMAMAIVADAEGATKVIEVTVRGAASQQDARVAARAVAGSNLLKAAVHGNDPNWGRIACAAGYSGAELDESRLDITIAGVPVLRQGRVLEFDEPAASAALRAPTVSILVDLGLGDFQATSWGCDLTEEYVLLNSEYTT